LDGEQSAKRDVVLLNAAAALVAASRADSIGDALPQAVEAVDSGRARQKMEALIRFTQAN
jgi:anthranilate phosphoribosyltransferase